MCKYYPVFLLLQYSDKIQYLLDRQIWVDNRVTSKEQMYIQCPCQSIDTEHTKKRNSNTTLITLHEVKIDVLPQIECVRLCLSLYGTCEGVSSGLYNQANMYQI